MIDIRNLSEGNQRNLVVLLLYTCKIIKKSPQKTHNLIQVIDYQTLVI